MIVRDDRSPRGRIVDMPTADVALPSFLFGAGGTSWRELNDTVGLIPDRAPRPPSEYKTLELECEQCGDVFVARHFTLAKTCSDKCRQAAHRERQR